MAPSANAFVADYDVLNPETPLAYLERGIGIQVMHGTYLHIGILAVIVWDLLHNLQNDYILLVKHRFRVATGAYFLSRLAVVVYAFGRAILLTSPVADCRRLELAIDSLLTTTLCLNTLLFYVRVCAVFYNQLSVIIFFGLFWCATVGMACIIPTAMTAIHIGPTRYCLEQIRTHYLIPTYLVFLLYDTFIFLATTYRFYKLYREEETSIQKGLRIAFFGSTMPAFSKAMLHENQLYYLAVPLVKLGIIIGALCFDSGSPGLVLISNLVPVHVMLANVVTCRVFRNTKLGLVREPVDLDFLLQSTRQSSHTVMQFFERARSGGSVKSEEREVKETYDFRADDGEKPVNLLAIRKDTNTITVFDLPSPTSDQGLLSPREGDSKV